MAANPVIRAEGLVKRFGPQKAVDGLSLTLAAGEVFALVGPDGAGKTTSLRMLCGVLDPDAGRALVLGHDSVAGAEAIKEGIGYMPQRFGLYDDLSVDENIAFHADLYRVPRAERARRTPELLAFSNLTPFRDRLAGALSGGMRQKLGLACALIHTPRLLILDEPTCGVDPVSRREFWQILYHLQAGGMTILVSTAYLDEAERAHRVGLMHRGRLLKVDEPRRLREGFVGELVEVELADQQAGRQALAGLPQALRVLARGDRLMVTVADRQRDWPPLERALRAAGLTDAAARPAEPSLEDVFVQIMDQEPAA
ncbi:MAG: ABC transporter ATP-binding protein [Thermodesulfobacteriota bacterium]